MKDLAIKRELDDETRKQAVWVRTRDGIETYSMHIKGDEVIITDENDFTKIYAIYSQDYFNKF